MITKGLRAMRQKEQMLKIQYEQENLPGMQPTKSQWQNEKKHPMSPKHRKRIERRLKRGRRD